MSMLVNSFFGGSHVFNWVDEPDVTGHTLNSETGAWTNFTLRQAIREDQIDGTGNYVRFSFRGGSTEGLTINKCYVGIRSGTGSSVDFVTAPTQVLFSGSTNTVIPAATTVTCDPVALVIGVGDSIVISVYVPGSVSANDTFACKDTSGLGNTFVSQYKAGDDAITQTVGGYSGTLPTCLVLDSLELSA